MSLICFISDPDNRNPIRQQGILLGSDREWERAGVSAQIAAKCQAEDQRQFEFFGEQVEIAHTKHDIIFLKGRGCIGNKIVVSQILFCLL